MTSPSAFATEPAVPGLDPRLAHDLARAAMARQGAGAVLRHLLAHDEGDLFGEEVIARVRGMIADVARQLAAGAEDAASQKIAAVLAEAPAFLGHVHALALEWRATTRLQATAAVPPVLSPLVQALVASTWADTADTAMRFLAAQARFARNAARMELPLAELPAEILHAALGAIPAEARAKAALGYDEGATRIALAARLVVAMGAGAVAALAPDHAGYALFASALAAATGRGRDETLLALQDPDGVQAAVMLRAARQPLAAIATALCVTHPDAPVPPLATVSPEAARALLLGPGGAA